MTAIADVRSSPFSRYTPQFNREPLQASLARAGVVYAFLGRELGARREERSCYDGREARYDLIAGTTLFRAGLDRIRTGLHEHRIALLCAEKDPITCHRMILVCRQFRKEPIVMAHVLEDGRLETHDETESRLLSEVGLPELGLFQDRESLIEDAYDRQGRRIAWMEPEGIAAESGLEGDIRS